MDRVACWTSPGDVHGLLGNAALEHVDMLVDKGSAICNTMKMKSGIDKALLSATDHLLQSSMKLDDRGGFFRQADMEQGLLFAICACGSEERWCTQVHDMSEVSSFHVVAPPPEKGLQGQHLQVTGRTRLATTLLLRCLMFTMVIIMLIKIHNFVAR